MQHAKLVGLMARALATVKEDDPPHALNEETRQRYLKQGALVFLQFAKLLNAQGFIIAPKELAHDLAVEASLRVPLKIGDTVMALDAPGVQAFYVAALSAYRVQVQQETGMPTDKEFDFDYDAGEASVDTNATATAVSTDAPPPAEDGLRAWDVEVLVNNAVSISEVRAASAEDARRVVAKRYQDAGRRFTILSVDPG